jgi:hypothetical protein
MIKCGTRGSTKLGRFCLSLSSCSMGHEDRHFLSVLLRVLGTRGQTFFVSPSCLGTRGQTFFVCPSCLGDTRTDFFFLSFVSWDTRTDIFCLSFVSWDTRTDIFCLSFVSWDTNDRHFCVLRIRSGTDCVFFFASSFFEYSHTHI